MQDRIQKILREEGMTAARFAEEIGIQASSVSHFLSGRNKPSTDILARILDRFRGINAEWLVTGRGNMYKDQDKTEKKNADSPDFMNNPSSVGDLFTNNAEKSEKTEEKPLESSVNSSEEKPEIPETTNNTIPHSSPKPVKQGEKQISHIVIFFTDNSFEYYKPGK